MKKRIVALVLVLVLLLPAALASAAYYRVNTSSLKVRVLPDEKTQQVASREQDFALTVSRRTGSWSYAKFTNGDEGYVMTKYITKCSSYTAYITSDNTPIRTGPAYNYANVGTLARGAKVTVLTHGKKYDYVKSSVGYGYVMNGWLSKKKVKASGNASVPAFTPADNYTAWVSNGTKTVNLRAGAGTNFPVIAAYPTTTQVTVLVHGPDWDYVQIGTEVGFMMTRFLTRNAPAPIPAGAAPAPQPGVPYTAFVTSANMKGVNVHRHAGMGETVMWVAAYGSTVTVVEHGAKWDKIQQNGKTGYILNKYLQLAAPAPAPVTEAPPVVEPTAAPTPFQPYSATVTCKEGEKVNFRKKPWADSTALFRLDPGTVVTVVGPGTYKGKTYSKWVMVEYGGTTGYIQREFLK